MSGSNTQIVADMSSGGAWKGRGSLRTLVAELERQKDSKIDFVADQRTLRFGIVPDGGGPVLMPGDAQTSEWIGSPHTFTNDALTQFGDRQEPPIPRKFLKAAIDAHPDELKKYINETMAKSGKRNLVRCLDGQVRAVLSDSYRCIDNHDVAFEALKAVRDNGGEVVEATLSDKFMRIKFTSRSIFEVLDTVRGGDKGGWFAGGIGNQEWLGKVGARTKGDLPGGPGTVHPLVTITNSETGFGRFTVSIGILQAICFNLATVEDMITRVHLDEKMEVGVFSAETIEKEATAIYAKARDVIHAAFDVRTFKAIVDRVRPATQLAVTAPSSAADNIIKASDGALVDQDKDALLAYFGDYAPTAYGLAQAVSRLAQDTDDADRGQDIEAFAGKMMTSPALVA